MQHRTAYQILSWLLLALSAVLLFMPTSPVPDAPKNYVDSFAHASVFFVLTITFLQAYRQRAVLAGLILYALSTELIQYFFVPSRGAEVSDVISNIIGIAAGWLLIQKIEPIKQLFGR